MRSVLAALGVALLATTCAAQAEQAAESMSARAILDEYVIHFWAERDTTALGRALAPDMIYHYNGKVVPGDPSSHQKYLRSFGGAFADLSASVDVFTVSGDLGAAVTTWTGTHQGEYCHAPGTGTRLTWSVNYVFRVSGGRIVELWEAWDEGGTYRLMGVDPAQCD